MCVVDAVDHSHSGKVLLCHYPTGGSPNTLSIATSAVDAHLTSHTGDHLGACYGGCGTGARMNSTEPEISATDVIKVYPNPATMTLYFEFPSSNDVVIKLMDITGRVMGEQVVHDKTMISFDIKGYTPGIYLYQVITNGIRQSGKVVVGKQ